MQSGLTPPTAVIVAGLPLWICGEIKPVNAWAQWRNDANESSKVRSGCPSGPLILVLPSNSMAAARPAAWQDVRQCAQGRPPTMLGDRCHSSSP